ncbi:MAG: CotH kinase family protein [Verrucomicrobiales bacterium]|nr:CotH kinase family protein [Verrucomicrobiales bacterium]
MAGCNRSGTPSAPDPPVRAKEPQVQAEPPRGRAKEPLAQGNGLQRRANQEDVDAFFANPTIVRIEIEISRSGMSALRRTHWENGQERPVVKATITEGGIVYSNVAIHLKGAAGSFRSVDDKPALTLSFSKFEPGQAFHGLRKISLNNSVQDSSYLSEKICRELFIAAGVPVPRAAHAMVTLNGRDLGLYVLLEGANKQFLKRYFNDASGNLYDGGFCKDIRASLAINCGDNPKEHSGLRALLSAVREAKRDFARLDQVLDTDRFLSMVAMEMMTCHWDGYTMNRNNWRVFHDLDSKKMVFIPHGLDQMFGSGRQIDPGIAPQRISGEVARAILGTREGQRRYHERVGYLYTNVFKVEEIMNRVDEIITGIRPALVDSHPEIARSLRQQASRLKQRIIRRGESLRRQLGVPIKSSEFGRDGILRLTGWKPLVLSGNPTLAQVDDPAGKAILTINAGTGTSSSSWRTRIALGAGRYQFEGRIRVTGVMIDDGDIRGGAGLRISKGTMPQKLTGTSEWVDYRYPFAVEDDVTEVELISELRAANGEASFDTSSLRLIRLQ